MSLYILLENSSSYFFETRRKQEIASIKSLNQKRIPTIVFENIEDVPEIFTDSEAVLLVAHGLNEDNQHCVKTCNENGIPVGFYGEPEDCSGIVSLLCSDEGRYITGQNIFVDGGKSVQ